MSLNRVMDLASTAMSAQSLRLNTTASNLANADTVSSSVNEVYRSRQPVFSTIHNQELEKEMSALRPNGGVEVLGVVESAAPPRKEYQPDHPLADEQGYIFRPNVNPVEEMANMISASRSYQTNVDVAAAARDMYRKTLTLGQ
ncbi:flagellar basal body rod protein FlgC [Pelagibaculum spongiae]|uniref:Flagellar basal-body rod protein FlgC n=1 Tax=Pelagibaculum spongiae TaxID=2080658 RepID=A0A2V1GXT1_9GAMM|nr:flagellar basal body rod protein FlgC [Pelagibaculum spongiae]PVZ66746.1 flagellar basal body rod protein FlgC [Pelagibaculum spongiae]